MVRHRTKLMWVFGICLACMCKIVSSQGKAYPDVASLLKHSYQTHVEYTDQSKNESQFMRELHDRAGHKGYIETLSEGALRHEYYFVDTGEHVEIGDSCKVSKLSDHLRDDYKLQDGIIYARPSSILRELPTDQMQVQADTTVRGISVVHFRAERDDTRYNVYFRVGTWRGSDNDTTHIPVRVTVTDLKTNDTVLYDFHRFVRYVGGFSDMNLKVGVGCKGKKNPSKMVPPSIPSQVSFEYEILDTFLHAFSPAQALELHKMWYDSAQKLARIDFSSMTKKDVAEIHDFNTGVVYKKQKGKECHLQHIEASTFSYTSSGRSVPFMKTPDQLLGLAGDLYYVGGDIMRGASCDVWESVEENVTLSGIAYDSVVTTFYFTRLRWLSTVDGSDDVFIPLKKVVRGYLAGEVQVELSINIFDYTEESSYDPDFYKNFNVADCFAGPEARTYFDIYLESGVNVTAMALKRNYRLIRRIAKEQLYTLAGISPLRIPDVFVTVKEDNSLEITAILLAQPSALASFVMSNIRAVPGENMRKLANMASQEECAKICLPDPDCVVFLYGNHECYTSGSADWTDWGKALLPKHYQEFTKSDINITSNYQPNTEVIKKVKDEVDSGSFVISFPEDPKDTASPRVSYKGVRFTADTSPFGERVRENPYEQAEPNKVFTLTKDTVMKAKPLGARSEILSVQQCYRTCVKENSLDCASFSYCPDTKDCRLSSQVVVRGDPDPKGTVAVDTRCNIYTRSYLQLFEKFPGRVVRVGGDASVPGIASATDCAKQCKHSKDLRCRGFEFCENTNFCILHAKHFLDINDYDIDNGSDSCSHYAAKFSVDYWEVGRKVINDPNSRTVKLVSLEECAKQCSLDTSGLCRSFEFCPGDDGPQAKCVLNTITILDDGVRLVDSPDCYHYYQQDDVHDFVTNGRANLKLYYPGEGSVTAASLGGLLFGMVLLGLLIAPGTWFAFNYWKSRRQNDDGHTVRFVQEAE